MNDIPSNAVPYLVGFPVFALFGLRGYKNYRRLHNPLSGYFALSGMFASLAFFFWSVPFAISQDQTFLLVANILGDFFLYAMFVLQADLVYYLTLRNKMSRVLFVGPAFLLAVVGLISNSYGYIQNGLEIVDDKLVYSLPLLSSIIQIILLVNVFLVGILMLGKLKELASGRSKTSLVSVAILYIFAALGGAINVVLSGDPNDSPLIIGSYIGGFMLFVLILLSVRFIKKSSI